MGDVNLGLLFSPNLVRITGCSSSTPINPPKDAGEKDSTTPPDIITDTHDTDGNYYWPDIFPDILPDIDIVKPDVLEPHDATETHDTPDTPDIPDSTEITDTPDTADSKDTPDLPCLPSIEVPYDHIAQSCVIDLADVDGDGFCKQGYVIEDKLAQCPNESGNVGTDCNDLNLLTNPIAAEVCNNIDDNCNNQTDENLTLVSYSGPAGTENIGECQPKIEQCINGNYQTTQQEIKPQVETCNIKDDDCDNQTDEDTTVSSYAGPFGTEGVGLCQPEIKVCQNGILTITQFQVLPQQEIACNGDDEDCDGIVFQGSDADGDTFKSEGGLCGPTDCNDNDASINPNTPEICGNGVDENCDGKDFIGKEIRVTNDPAGSYMPSLAWSNGNYAIAWYDKRDGNDEIYFAQVDSNGIKMGNDKNITNHVSSSAIPSLVAINPGYCLAWQDDRDGNLEIYFAFLNSNGIKTGNDIRISNAQEWSIFPSMVWNGSGCAIAWEDGRNTNIFPQSDIFFSYYNESQVTEGASLAENTSLVWNNNGYGIAWEDGKDGNEEIYFNILSSFGDNLSGNIRVTNDPFFSGYPSLAWNNLDLGYGLAWTDDRDGKYEIYFARLDSNGNKIGNDTRITFSQTNTDDPTLLWNGLSYKLVWIDARNGNNEIYFTTLDANGLKLHADTRITFNSVSTNYASIVWNGSGLGVTWSDIKDGNPEIYLSIIECP